MSILSTDKHIVGYKNLDENESFGQWLQKFHHTKISEDGSALKMPVWAGAKYENTVPLHWYRQPPDPGEPPTFDITDQTTIRNKYKQSMLENMHNVFSPGLRWFNPPISAAIVLRQAVAAVIGCKAKDAKKIDDFLNVYPGVVALAEKAYLEAVAARTNYTPKLAGQAKDDNIYKLQYGGLLEILNSTKGIRKPMPDGGEYPSISYDMLVEMGAPCFLHNPEHVEKMKTTTNRRSPAYKSLSMEYLHNTCIMCQVLFTDCKSLIDHWKSCSRKLNYQCCGTTFSDPKEAVAHAWVGCRVKWAPTKPCYYCGMDDAVCRCIKNTNAVVRSAYEFLKEETKADEDNIYAHNNISWALDALEGAVQKDPPPGQEDQQTTNYSRFSGKLELMSDDEPHGLRGDDKAGEMENTKNLFPDITVKEGFFACENIKVLGLVNPLLGANKVKYSLTKIYQDCSSNIFKNVNEGIERVNRLIGSNGLACPYHEPPANCSKDPNSISHFAKKHSVCQMCCSQIGKEFSVLDKSLPVRYGNEIYNHFKTHVLNLNQNRIVCSFCDTIVTSSDNRAPSLHDVVVHILKHKKKDQNNPWNRPGYLNTKCTDVNHFSTCGNQVFKHAGDLALHMLEHHASTTQNVLDIMHNFSLDLTEDLSDARLSYKERNEALQRRGKRIAVPKRDSSSRTRSRSVRFKIERGASDTEPEAESDGDFYTSEGEGSEEEASEDEHEEQQGPDEPGDDEGLDVGEEEDRRKSGKGKYPCKNQDHRSRKDKEKYTFATQALLNLHIKTAHKCNMKECWFSDEDNNKIWQHYQTAHPVRREFCEICNMFVPELQLHSPQHQNCSVCDKTFPNQDTAREHEKTCTNVSTKEYTPVAVSYKATEEDMLHPLMAADPTMQFQSELVDKDQHKHASYDVLTSLLKSVFYSGAMPKEECDRLRQQIMEAEAHETRKESEKWMKDFQPQSKKQAKMKAPKFFDLSNAGKLPDAHKLLTLRRPDDVFDAQITNKPEVHKTCYRKLDSLNQRIGMVVEQHRLDERSSNCLLISFLSTRVQDVVMGVLGTEESNFANISYQAVLDTLVTQFCPIDLIDLHEYARNLKMKPTESFFDFAGVVRRLMIILGGGLFPEGKEKEANIYKATNSRIILYKNLPKRMVTALEEKEREAGKLLTQQQIVAYYTTYVQKKGVPPEMREQTVNTIQKKTKFKPKREPGSKRPKSQKNWVENYRIDPKPGKPVRPNGPQTYGRAERDVLGEPDPPKNKKINKQRAIVDPNPPAAIPAETGTVKKKPKNPNQQRNITQDKERKNQQKVIPNMELFNRDSEKAKNSRRDRSTVKEERKQTKKDTYEYKKNKKVRATSKDVKMTEESKLKRDTLLRMGFKPKNDEPFCFVCLGPHIAPLCKKIPKDEQDKTPFHKSKVCMRENRETMERVPHGVHRQDQCWLKHKKEKKVRGILKIPNNMVRDGDF